MAPKKPLKTPQPKSKTSPKILNIKKPKFKVSQPSAVVIKQEIAENFSQNNIDSAIKKESTIKITKDKAKLTVDGVKVAKEIKKIEKQENKNKDIKKKTTVEKFRTASELTAAKKAAEPKKKPVYGSSKSISNKSFKETTSKSEGAPIGDSYSSISLALTSAPSVSATVAAKTSDIIIQPSDARTAIALEIGKPELIPEEQEFIQTNNLDSLNDAEKPYILGIINKDVGDNGCPKKIVLIIKKLISDRFRHAKYTILRKNVFYENDYKNIGEVVVFDVLGSIDRSETKKIIQNYGFNLSDVFEFVDRDIQPDNIYSYKIKLEYFAGVQEETGKGLLQETLDAVTDAATNEEIMGTGNNVEDDFSRGGTLNTNFLIEQSQRNDAKESDTKVSEDTEQRSTDTKINFETSFRKLF